jgi:hypothetical protein
MSSDRSVFMKKRVAQNGHGSSHGFASGAELQLTLQGQAPNFAP